jgi:hypothetical protein
MSFIRKRPKNTFYSDCDDNDINYEILLFWNAGYNCHVKYRIFVEQV